MDSLGVRELLAVWLAVEDTDIFEVLEPVEVALKETVAV